MVYPVPKEFIVVEGRSDTARLREVYGNQIRTIETKGSSISEEIINEIKFAQKQVGVIVLTDPDYPGQRIRQIISQKVPNAKHAYLNKLDAIGKKASQNVGVEYASDQVIIEAISSISNLELIRDRKFIPLAQLMDLGLVGNEEAKDKRQFIANELNLGYFNGKQMQKRLSMYGITYEQLREVLNKYDKV